MKLTKKIVSLFMVLTILFGFSVISTHAHEALLEVDYDNCVASEFEDGIDEAWYILNTSSLAQHIGHEVTTIKYYFAEEERYGRENPYTWTTAVSETVANEIKTAYANSMKKWNNVYFYSHDSTGNIVKNKIINVEEAINEEDANLVIYPADNLSYFAETIATETPEILESGDGMLGEIDHWHRSKWIMIVCVDYFYVNGDYDADFVTTLRNRTGAHELGHVLGLLDVDNFCSAKDQEDHHHELLMGYGLPVTDRSTDITYKDIAGVAITRGFHTDADHKWLNCGLQNDGQYKLVCTICNGVKKVDSLSGYTYDTYGSCNGNHELSDGNMMAVASYGNKDYYKCKYCRYVAPFSDLVPQRYTREQYNDTYHKCVSAVSGLNYSFLQEHTIIGGRCKGCGHIHTTHSYDYETVYHDHDSHLKKCVCGASQEVPHSVRASEIVDGRYATCLGCKVPLDLTVDSAQVGYFSITKVSVNGSYILDNGIVVLVDADVTAYLNGTLQFYDPDKLPSVA